MEEKIELLREKLHEAIDKGNSNEILRVSIALDAEIVKSMIALYTLDTFIVQNKELYVEEGSERRCQMLLNNQ